MSVEMDIDVKLGKKAEQLKKSVLVKCLEKASINTALDTQKELVKTAPVDTGNLRRSVSIKQKDLTGFTITGAYYWSYLNYGTSRMAPRPFVTEAASGILADYSKNLKKELADAGLK